jgi:hypothetical protein
MIARSPALVASSGDPVLLGEIETVAYRVIATLQTKPPTSFEYGGTSVHPPPKSMRVGARVTMGVVTMLGARRWKRFR